MSEAHSMEFLTASDFEALVNERARRLGKSIAELRDYDEEILRHASFEREGCLNPFEIEMFFSDELPETRMKHGAECPECAALLSVAHPGATSLADFVKEYRAQETPSETPVVSKQSFWIPLIDMAMAEAPLLAALFLLSTAIIIIPFNDVIIQVLLSNVVVKYGAVAVVTMVVSVTLVMLCKVIFSDMRSYSYFIRHGGAFIGSVCSLVAVVVLGKFSFDLYNSYSLIKMSENILAQASTSNLSNNDIALMEGSLGNQVRLDFISLNHDTITATSEKYDGKLVAQKFTDLAKLYWKFGKDNNKEIGTVLQGLLKIDDKGQAFILSEDKEYGVDKKLIGSFKNWERVVYIVSPNTEKVSKIISMVK